MKKILALCMAIIFTTALLSSCSSSTFDPSTAYRGQTAKQLFDNGIKSIKTEYYQTATQYFQTLDARYPFSPYTERAQLDIIYAYYMNDDDGSAMAAAERFIHLHPNSEHVDYAYYMRALSHYDSSIGLLERHLPIDFATRDLTAARKSFLEFAEVVNRFPNSRYVADARKRMVYLRNLLASHQLEVAKFYYKHKAYVAAANRANGIVLHFQQTPEVPAALRLMYQSYKALGLDGKASTIAAIYQLNYPSAGYNGVRIKE